MTKSLGPIGFHYGMLVALHAIIKKTQKTPADELALARQRFKELQSWQRKTPT
jgi:phage-related protein